MFLHLLLCALICNAFGAVEQSVVLNNSQTFECSQADDLEFKKCLEGASLASVYLLQTARVHQKAASRLTGIDSVHVINLERRGDRLQQFFSNSGLSQDEVNVFTAVDKLTLSMTDPIKKMFELSDYSYRRGIVACALSHLSLWEHIAATKNQTHLIFEDDAVFAPNFKATWNQKYANALPLDARLVYLGGMLDINKGVYHVGTVLHPVNRAIMSHLPTRFFSHDFIDDIDIGVRGGASRRYFYTAVAYAIHSDAARYLVDMVNAHGFRRGADHVLYRVMDRFEQVYATHPLLVHQAAPKDTDIQDDMLPVGDPPKLTRVSNATAFNDIGPLRAVPTFVINLDRSPDRMLHFAMQAERAHLNVSRMAAVDGSKLDMEGLRKRNVLGPRYPWNWRGSAACALSHFILYEQMLASNATHYLIFEDDAYLSADFLTRLSAAATIVPADWDILNVGCFGWSCEGTHVVGNIMAANTKVHIHCHPLTAQCVSGTSSYLITRQGARTMLDVCLPMNENIDKQSRDHYGTRLKFYCTSPTLSEQNWDLRSDRIERDRVPSS